MKTIDIRCASSPTKVHRMRPVDGQYMLCLDCEFSTMVLEHVFIAAAVSNASVEAR